MPKYTKLLAPKEYKKLTTDEKIEYVLDMATILKTTRDYTQRPGSPLRPPPSEKPNKD